MNQQELHIKETLPALSFNYDQLKEWAHGLTARYADMVVTEDSVADVKRDMAELNKNKAKLETARKETVRRLSEPIRSFEAQVKEVVGIFDAAYAGLAGQVKAFEDAASGKKARARSGYKKHCNACAHWPSFPHSANCQFCGRGRARWQAASEKPCLRAMSIVLEYDTINEAQVKACLETLKPLCVSFGARYR